MLITQSAQARRAQHKELAVHRDVKPEPARRKHAQHMPAREQHGVSRNAADSLHDPVRARADLLGRLAAGTAVTEQFPPWAFSHNVGGSPAFILAVIPLDQIFTDLRD